MARICSGERQGVRGHRDLFNKWAQRSTRQRTALGYGGIRFFTPKEMFMKPRAGGFRECRDGRSVFSFRIIKGGSPMKRFQKTKGGRLTAGLLAAMVLILACAAGSASAGVCERALTKCLIDFGLPNLASLLASGAFGLVAGLVLAQFCYNGYLFCVQYY
jgi:hypothetical protein